MRLTTWLSVLLISFKVAIIFGVSLGEPSNRLRGVSGAPFSELRPLGVLSTTFLEFLGVLELDLLAKEAAVSVSLRDGVFCEDAPLPLTAVVTCVVVLDGGIVFLGWLVADFESNVFFSTLKRSGS